MSLHSQVCSRELLLLTANIHFEFEVFSWQFLTLLRIAAIHISVSVFRCRDYCKVVIRFYCRTLWRSSEVTVTWKYLSSKRCRHEQETESPPPVSYIWTRGRNGRLWWNEATRTWLIRNHRLSFTCSSHTFSCWNRRWIRVATFRRLSGPLL